MRLPLRHPPPASDPPLARCAHLERLAEAAIGVPLGPAAALVASERARGRHGNALQWHLGLEPHDGDARLDWEDRIEIKLVTVWGRPDGEVSCDKVKVCDLAVDPWHKLSNVLWVFADRLTRVVVDAAFSHLGGPMRLDLAASWGRDPHFEAPDLFVEARQQGLDSAPAYYLAHRWFRRVSLLPDRAAVFRFDATWWRSVRSEFGRDPLATLVAAPTARVACPRCGGPLRTDAARVEAHGWAPAWHGMPLGPACAVAGHFVLDRRWLRSSPVQTEAEFDAAVEGRLPRGETWRLATRVPEPDDHRH